ncbi:MAG TPA: response regulator, partial [Burkholderiaceae bacterium]|nr:response regulator [Burkholderiaceae bacterium]
MSYAALFTGSPPAHTEPPKQTVARYRVLLVDDEPNVLSALKRVFRQENYEIVTAANGSEALIALKTQAFHVVISDFMMPGMDGGEVLRQVRALQPDSIRMMLTGHADVGAVVAAVKAGAVYKFMLKSWNDDDLRVTVALAIEQHELVQKNRRLQQQNDSRAKELETLAKLTVSNRSQIAIMLHKRNLLTTAQVQELFRLQQQRKEPVIRILLD